MARFTLGDLVWRVTGDTKDYDKSLDASEKKTKQFSIKSVAALGAIAIAGVAAFRRISRAVSESIQLYGRQVEAESGLQAALRATGQEVDRVFPQYAALAQEIQAVTTVGDEAALEMISLATSMGITADQMDETIKGAIGLSDAFGIGTQQALRGVTNALQGNFEQLQRYIPALRTAETEAEKLAIVQNAMAGGFEVSQARAQTAFGALQQYGNAVGDLKEQLGQNVTEGIEPFVRALTSFVGRVTDAISRTREFRSILEALSDTGDSGAQSTDALVEALDRLEEAERRILRTGRERANENLGNIRQNIALIRAEITERDKLAALEMRYGAQGREVADARAKALIAEAEAAARAAEINRTAWEKRLEITEDFSERIFRREADTLAKIEREREQALADAAASYVRTGDEILLINRYYDELRAEEQARIDETERERLADLAAFQREVVEERRERELATLQDIQEEYERTAEAIFDYLEPTFIALGEALSGVEDGWVSLGQTAVRSIATVIRALAREFAARAVGAFAMGNVPLGSALAAASAAALVASGVVAGLASQIQSAAMGADFTTNGPQLMLVGDNPGGRERVTVEPLSSPNVNGPGEMLQVQINLDGEAISRFITRGTRNGRILVDQRAVV